MKQIYNLKIDDQLRDLLPPLLGDEYKQLEQNIINNGCQSPLFVWNGYIADGHNRYSICQKHNIPFDIIELAYDTKEDLMKWMIDTQLGRRNLTVAQKVLITEKFRDMFEEKAKENQLSTLKQNQSVCPISDKREKVDTYKELARIAGTGKDTYSKATKILKSNNEELKQAILSGDKTINAAYNELTGKKKPQKKPVQDIKPPAPKKSSSKDSEDIECTNVEETPTPTPPNTDFIDSSGQRTCRKCGTSYTVDNFPNDGEFCTECLKKISGGEIIDTTSINTSTKEGKILKDLKTPKIAADYIVVENELLSIKNSIYERIETAYERIFERYDLPNKMGQADKENAISYMNQLIGEIMKLKNKIEKIEIKGE